MWGPQADQPDSKAGRPHRVVVQALLRWNTLWSLLESSHVGTIVDKLDFL